MKYTQIPTDTFEKLQLNAGILATSFAPATGVVTGMLGATTGGFSFSDSIDFVDFGEDVDNCPRNMLELKKIDGRTITMSGTFVTVSEDLAQKLAGAADASSGKITPRDTLKASDFTDIWWIGDYSNVNEDSGSGSSATTAGFIAIHMMNVLNTSGFQIQSTDRGKGQFAFEFTAHYSMATQDVVPYEIYVQAGTAPTT